MEIGFARLDVYFEDPFWVGLCQRGGGGTWEVCRIVFGAEPRDCEVYAYLLKHYDRLKFSPSMEGGEPLEQKAPNPKRRRRQIKRQLETMRTGTKAQQALSLQREQGKADRKRQARENREAERERQFALRREKQKEKHRGH